MTITFDWDTEAQETLIVKFADTWTWNDFHAQILEAHAFAGSVDHPVDMILWHTTDLPDGNPLSHFDKASKQQPPNIRKVVVVNPGAPAALRAFLGVLSNIVERVNPGKSKVMIVATLEEARAYLNDTQTSR